MYNTDYYYSALCETTVGRIMERSKGIRNRTGEVVSCFDGEVEMVYRRPARVSYVDVASIDRRLSGPRQHV